jgi:hypothetical protein
VSEELHAVRAILLKIVAEGRLDQIVRNDEESAALEKFLDWTGRARENRSAP